MDENECLSIVDYETHKVIIDLYNCNQIVLECFGWDVEDEFAYYIYRDDVIIKRIMYSHSSKCTWWAEEDGVYKIKVFVKNKDGKIKAFYSDSVVYDRKKILQEINKEKTLGQKIFSIVKEIWTNRFMMLRVAMFDYRLRNKDSYLGRVWEILTPLIQIGTYWFVFGIGMRQGRDVDGYPYLLWMLSGLIPWFCISASIIKGANSIFTKAATITKLNYPIATVPIGVIITEGFEFAFTLVILEVVFLFHGYLPNWGYLNLIYYTIYMFSFLASLALITSVCTMVARDFQKLLSSLIRFLFYLTPILWDMKKMPELFQMIVGVSPLYYVIRGFRDSLLYDVPFYSHRTSIVIEWGIVVVLFVFGCYLQEKFRNRFRDLI